MRTAAREQTVSGDVVRYRSNAARAWANARASDGLPQPEVPRRDADDDADRLTADIGGASVEAVAACTCCLPTHQVATVQADTLNSGTAQPTVPAGLNAAKTQPER